MKGERPVITLLGSNSGNNVGDAAILSGILDALTERLPDAEFLVPTVKPEFINENYGARYRVRAMNIMPWNLSFRFLGLPTLKCLWRSDAALICDGIIFGKKLFNPAFNMLVTLAPLALFAKLFGCKLVCYSVGIGPFPNGRGSGLAKYLIQACELVMMRENDSKKLAEQIGVTRKIEITGDAAYLNPTSSNEVGLKIAQAVGIRPDKKIIGINVTSYVDSWVANGETKLTPQDLIVQLQRSIEIAQNQIEDHLQPVIFSTHPMDETLALELGKSLAAPVVSNTTYLSHDLQAVMARCSLFIGMRFHSLVLASSVGVPIIGLIYAPKVKGLMADLSSAEYGVPLTGLKAETIAISICLAWKERDSLRARQQKVVEEFKLGANRAADRLVESFFADRQSVRVADAVANAV